MLRHLHKPTVVQNHLTQGIRCTISVVYPCDFETDWELRLAAAIQHHKRVSYQISLAQENIEIQNMKYSFSWMCIAFIPSQSQKIVRWTVVKDHHICWLKTNIWLSYIFHKGISKKKMDIAAKQIHTQIKSDSFCLSSFTNHISHTNTEQLRLSFLPLVTTLRAKSNLLL